MISKTKIIKGGFFLTIVNVISQILAVVINIILARILAPEDFGLIALTTTFMAFIRLFTSLGFGASVIHGRNSTINQLSSIFWLNIGICIISFIAIQLSANFAAEFYDKDELENLIRLASLNVLITPIFIIHYKILERDLEFKTISIINLSGTLIGSIAAVIAAFQGFGVYALLFQPIISSIVRLILVLINNKWKPKIYFNFQDIKSMVWYSIKFKGSSTALYFERNIDYLILGKLFTSTVLGYYAFAYNIMYTPVKRISNLFSEVLFPSFSSFQNDKQKIIRGYFKSLTLVAMISVPAMTILAYNAELIVQTVFGDKWDGAIPIVRILCFAGALQSISQFGNIIFSSIGKPEISMYVSICRTILTTMAIIIGSKYGVLSVAYALVISKLLSFIIFLLILNYEIKFTFGQLINSLKGPIVLFVSLTLLYLFYISNYFYLNSWKLLLTMIIISLFFTYIFHKKIIIEIIKVLNSKTY